MKKIYYSLLGIISTSLLIVNLILFTLLILCIAPFSYLVPVPVWRRKCISIVMNIPAVWYRSCYYLLKINRSIQWEVTGESLFNKKGCYLLICNHISWLDIPVVAGVYSFKVPVIKFFMKKELLWSVPLVGLACKLLGYPFLERGSHRAKKQSKNNVKDIDTTQKACNQIKDHPTTLFMFAEGTRVSEEKQKKQRSPYQWLLKPRVGGVAAVLNNLEDRLDGIIDVTLNYEPRKFTLLGLSLGRVKKIQITSRIIPIDSGLIGHYHQNLQFKKEMRAWIYQVWQQKDATLEKMIHDD